MKKKKIKQITIDFRIDFTIFITIYIKNKDMETAEKIKNWFDAMGTFNQNGELKLHEKLQDYFDIKDEDETNFLFAALAVYFLENEGVINNVSNNGVSLNFSKCKPLSKEHISECLVNEQELETLESLKDRLSYYSETRLRDCCSDFKTISGSFDGAYKGYNDLPTMSIGAINFKVKHTSENFKYLMNYK